MTASKAPSRRKRPLRFTDQVIDGKRRPAAWVGMTILAAMAVDSGLAMLGVSHPILLVSGFWRSGTTWLQECFAESIGAKTVFEPLSPMEPRRREVLSGAFASEDVLQAFVPGPNHDAAFWQRLEAAAHGRIGSRFALSCRQSFWESFRAAIVVKDVRLHRNLRAVHKRLGIPVVHIRRHPCAVVASLRAANWHWSFDRVSLLDYHLPQVDPGFLRDCDADALSRLAAMWALHEREAASALGDKPWAWQMTYEALVQAPERQIEAAARKLGLRMACHPRTDRPSASIDPTVFPHVATRGIDVWRTMLNKVEISRIEFVASTIYPGWNAHWAGLTPDAYVANSRS